MRRGFLFLLCLTAAPGQVSPREPFDIAIQSYFEARNSGNLNAAADRRAEARDLLRQTAVDSPVFLNSDQNVAQLYQNSVWHAQARTVVEDALSRANSLGESHPIRIQLLSMLGSFWQQDENLLKALFYHEKAIAA